MANKPKKLSLENAKLVEESKRMGDLWVIRPLTGDSVSQSIYRPSLDLSETEFKTSHFRAMDELYSAGGYLLDLRGLNDRELGLANEYKAGLMDDLGIAGENAEDYLADVIRNYAKLSPGMSPGEIVKSVVLDMHQNYKLRAIKGDQFDQHQEAGIVRQFIARKIKLNPDASAADLWDSFENYALDHSWSIEGSGREAIIEHSPGVKDGQGKIGFRSFSQRVSEARKS